jgi:hypothetical protein
VDQTSSDNKQLKQAASKFLQIRPVSPSAADNELRVVSAVHKISKQKLNPLRYLLAGLHNDIICTPSSRYLNSKLGVVN